MEAVRTVTVPKVMWRDRVLYGPASAGVVSVCESLG